MGPRYFGCIPSQDNELSKQMLVLKGTPRNFQELQPVFWRRWGVVLDDS